MQAEPIPGIHQLADWPREDLDRMGTATSADWLAARPIMRSFGVTLHLDISAAEVDEWEASIALDGWYYDETTRGAAVTADSLVAIVQAERLVLAQKGAAS